MAFRVKTNAPGSPSTPFPSAAAAQKWARWWVATKGGARARADVERTGELGEPVRLLSSYVRAESGGARHDAAREKERAQCYRAAMQKRRERAKAAKAPKKKASSSKAKGSR